MSQQRNTNFIKKIIYSLKRKFGFSVSIYKVTSVTLDLETGEKETITERKKVKRVILLPVDITRTYVPAIDKVIQTGGAFDPQDRFIIIDKKDLGTFELKIDDYIIFDENLQ